MKAIICALSLCCFSFSVFGEEGNSKDWFWNTNNGFYVAGTVNSEENKFLRRCRADEESRGCIYFLENISVPCETGYSYPGLVSSNVGIFHVNFTCYVKDKQVYSYTIGDFKDIEITSLSGKRITFVLPLQTDHFNVYRFSLDGSRRAIETVHKLFLEETTRPTNETL